MSLSASSTKPDININSDAPKKGYPRRGSFLSIFNLASNERTNEHIDVDIQLYDCTKMRVAIDSKTTGKILVNHIATELGDVTRAKYLGLIIEPLGKFPEWMDLNNSVAKEKAAKGFNIIMVRIKFYPADPISEMKPDCFAILLYYQLRHDLAVGRLLGKEHDRCLLVAYSVQYERGLQNVPRDKLFQYDIVSSKIFQHGPDHLMQNQIKEILHQNYNISSNDALNAFLMVSTRMDTYGIEPFDAKDQRGNGVAVGFNFKGLSVFKSSQQVNFFAWESMLNYECERKNAVITIKTPDLIKKIGFKSDSKANALQLLRRLREASQFYNSSPNKNSKNDSEKPPKISTPHFSKSADSEASNSLVAGSPTCKIQRISTFSRPQRIFALSLTGMPRRTDRLSAVPMEATSFTNEPSSPLNCPPDIPLIHLRRAGLNEEADSFTATHCYSVADHIETNVTIDSKATEPIVPEDLGETEITHSLETEPDQTKILGKVKEENNELDGSQVDMEGKEESYGEGEMVKALRKNDSDQVEKINKGDWMLPKERSELHPLKISSRSDSTSQENLNMSSPFGDASKMQLFANLNMNRSRLGILDLKMSSSMTSITIPPIVNSSAFPQSNI